MKNFFLTWSLFVSICLSQSLTVTPSSVPKGGTFLASWSGFSGNVNVRIYKGSNLWVDASTNVSGSGSQNLVTTDWEVRNDYKVRVELRSNTTIYREVGPLVVTDVGQFGAQVGTFNGVIAYSNGTVGNVSNEYNYYSGTNTGMKWQCVEFVNRYYAAVYAQNIRIAGHNANDYYPNAAAHGLTPYNNGGTTAPQVGDILCSGGGQYGHVAIIREIGSNYINVIQQNWNNNSSDNSMTLSYSPQNGYYTIGSFSSSYSVQGWLRKPTTSGFVKVWTGITSSSTIVKGVPFNVSFSLKETNNQPITLQSIAIAIHKPNGDFLFDAMTYTNISFTAGQERSYNIEATVFNEINNSPGSNYSIRVKGQMNNTWFDVTPASGATNPKAFTLVDPTLTVSPSTKTVSSGAGSFSLSVTSNVPWTVISDQSFLTYSPSSGNNNGSITVSYTSNGTTIPRTGRITVRGTVTGNPISGICDVTQEAVLQYSLSLSKGGGGFGKVKVNGSLQNLPYSAQFISGSNITLEAVPDPNNTFANWSGALSGNTNPTSITMNADKSVTANFNSVPINYTLSLTKGGDGSGKVKVNGSLQNLPYSAQFNSGSNITLEAVPDPNNTFANWSGALSGNTNPTSITMNADKSVTANFSAVSINYTLSLTKGGDGSGKVKVNGTLQTLPYSSQFNSGSSVTLEAVADANNTFANWSGALSGNTNPTSITMNADNSVTANFNATPGVPLVPVTSSETVQKGQDYWLDIQVGNQNSPVSELKVISFELNYSATVINDYVTYEVGTFITGAQATVVPDDQNGRVDAAIFRTTGGNSGYGSLIRFKFNVNNQAIAGQQITFTFGSILANDANGNVINITPQSKTLTVIEAAIVWPGDANNNGVVNILDINPIIVNYGATGPVRPNASNSWTGQSAPFWTAPSLTYIDCNGNGAINITDINVVIVNFGRTHTINSAGTLPYEITSSIPPLQVLVPQAPATPGDTVTVSIQIGSSNYPVDSVKVVSFELLYGTNGLKQYIEFIDYQVGSFLTNAQYTVIPDDSLVAAAVYRTSGGNSGFGELIKFRFKIKSTTPVSTSFPLSFGQVEANRSNGSVQPLLPLGSMLLVPVELTSFSATNTPSGIMLRWSTASELNNLGFEVQRSEDGSIFLPLAFVKGKGTSTERNNYEYLDAAPTGTFSYRLKQMDFDGTVSFSNVVTIESINSQDFTLNQNFPNPFNPSTSITFSLGLQSKVKLTIINALGEVVKDLVNDVLAAGSHNVVWNADSLPSGIYFAVLNAESSRGQMVRLVRKIAYMK